ncbi:MAG: hypothetical protein K0R09_3077 [Clostridiales bacterium]|jgi:hypothetical protein|nr:hypothetical protein [Clostridiales bacterium]
MLDKEIEKRISIMESGEYSFAKRFSRKDYIITAVVIILCMIILIIGACL